LIALHTVTHVHSALSLQAIHSATCVYFIQGLRYLCLWSAVA